MASINGIEIKNIKTFRGREYPTNYQGNIYFKGKKLGFWSQDGNGGCDYFDRSVETTLTPIAKEYYNRDTDASGIELELLLDEILNLKDYEKTFKKIIKDGYKALIVCTDKVQSMMIKEPKITDKETILNDNQIKNYIKDFTDKAYYKDNIKTYVFTDITDFDIVQGEI